jgi:hypothetical protein
MSITKSDSEKSLFVYVKDTNSDTVKRLAIPCDVQIGLSGVPSELQLNGRFSISTLEYVVVGSNGTINVSSDTTAVNVNVSSAPASGRINVYLPPRPRDGQIHIIKDSSGTSGTTPIDIFPPTGILIDGSTSKTLSTAYSSAVIYWMNNAWYNLIVSSGGGSYTPPTGTGIPHIVAGVQNAASSLIVNADVDTSAAIAVSKLAPGTNGQVLLTTAGTAAWGAGATVPTGTGIPHIVAGVQNAASSLIVNADVDTAAAVAVSKLAPGTDGYILATVAGVASWIANVSASMPTGCSTLVAVQDVATAGLTSDLALTANAFITLLRFTHSVGPSIDGIISGSGAFRFVIIRPSVSSVQIYDYTTSASSAANQFETAVALSTPGAGGTFAYDPTSARWINLGHQW